MKKKKIKVINNSSACSCNIDFLASIIISHYIRHKKTRKNAEFKDLGVKCSIEETEDTIIISFYDLK